MSAQLSLTQVTPLTLDPLLRKQPFTFFAADVYTAMMRNLDGLVTMSRPKKTEAYARLSSGLTQNAWLPRGTDTYRYMQDGFGAMFGIWQSEFADVCNIVDEVLFIFTAFGRSQFASGLFEMLRPDLLARLINIDDSDKFRSKCASALALGLLIAEGAMYRVDHCEPLFRVAFDQHAGIEARIHFLKMAALYMSHLDLDQMSLYALTTDSTVERLLDLLERHHDLQLAASTCVVLLLKSFQHDYPIALEKIAKRLKSLAKNSQPIRHNFKFLTVKNRVESIARFPEIGEQVTVDSIRKRLLLETFESVLNTDLAAFLANVENCFVRQMLKPERLKPDRSKNILVRAIRKVL